MHVLFYFTVCSLRVCRATDFHRGRPTVILLEPGGAALEVLAVVGRFRASLDIGINRGLKSSVVTVALGAACHHALVDDDT